MITISDSHPDVLDFCRIKRNRSSVRYANISVRATDAFMRAVERDDEWLLHYENPEDGIEVKRAIRAREPVNSGTSSQSAPETGPSQVASSGTPSGAILPLTGIREWK